MKHYSFSIHNNDLIDKTRNILALLNEIGPNTIAEECAKLITIIEIRIRKSKRIYAKEKRVTPTTLELYITLDNVLEILTKIKNDNNLINNLESCHYYLVVANELIDQINNHTPDEYRAFNSEVFYNEKIKEINKEKEELINEISDIKEKLETTTGESAKTKAALEEKKQELERSVSLIKKYEEEYKEERIQQQKINDAKKEWNSKIVKAFDDLKGYIKPIKNEHRRLSLLFWGYFLMSLVLVCCLFQIERIICCKIANASIFPTWETYLSLIAPVPIAIGGLWGFITLMHKVQRQLVILAKHIHEIEYVEGLLLTTNTLSTNINESMYKVNSAIDKLLNNHLNSRNVITEELSLEKEEKKDTMPYEEVIKIIKEVAGLAKSK